MWHDVTSILKTVVDDYIVKPAAGAAEELHEAIKHIGFDGWCRKPCPQENWRTYCMLILLDDRHGANLIER